MHPVLSTFPHDSKLVSPFHANLLSASLSGAFGGKAYCCYLNAVRHRLTHPHLIPGLLASAILNMDGIGGLAGWRWIFVSTSLSYARSMPES